MDDDEVMVGPSTGFPWTAYILADVPDYATAAAVCRVMCSMVTAGHSA